MGIAAYNRGSALVSRQIDETLPDQNTHVVKKLNAYPRGWRTIFGPTVIRPCNGRWYLMNGKEKGFARYSYEYQTLRDLFADWNCYVTGYGSDEHSFYYAVA